VRFLGKSGNDSPNMARLRSICVAIASTAKTSQVRWRERKGVMECKSCEIHDTKGERSLEKERERESMRARA
jgi:hypothetical protein